LEMEQIRREARGGKGLPQGRDLGFVEGKADEGLRTRGMIEFGVDGKGGGSESFEDVFEETGGDVDFSGEEFTGVDGMKNSNAHGNLPLAIFFRGCK